MGEIHDDRFLIQNPFEFLSNYTGEIVPQKLTSEGYEVVTFGSQTDEENNPYLSLYLRKPNGVDSAILLTTQGFESNKQPKVKVEKFSGSPTANIFGVVHSSKITYFIDYKENTLN